MDIQKISDGLYIRALEHALRRVMKANRDLGRIKDGITLYERSPTKDDDSFVAWQELNDALKEAKTVLDGDPQAGPEIIMTRVRRSREKG